MTRAAMWWLLAAGAGVSTLPARALAQGAPADSVAWAAVTYLSGNLVYLGAGTKQGVQGGAHLRVFHAGAEIGELLVQYVSSNSASGLMTRASIPVSVGDSVRFRPVLAAAPPPTLAAGGTPVRSTRGAAPRHPLRGRIGLRYLVVESGTGSRLTQPAFDLRLDGQELGSSGIGVTVDVRAQHSSFSIPGGGSSPTSLTRVYQAAMQWHPSGSATHLSVGRQFAGALATIGIFDGLALDFVNRRWSYGLLAGMEPEAASFGVSPTTQEYGVYLQRHNVVGSGAPWNLTLGAIGSYDHGQINREFGYLRAMYTSRRLSFYGAQEVDINRGWKRVVEGSSATFTSTFITTQLSVSDGFSLNAGFDNRRTIRLYRDYINPEITFDDSFREGVWGGASLRITSRILLSGDARSSSGGTEGTAQSYTGSLSATRLTPLGLGLRFRATQYTGQVSAGTLSSAAVDIAPVRAIRISFNGGIRNTRYPMLGTPATRLTWTGVDADVSLGRALYLMLSTYREAGAPDRTTQSYLALSYRF